jgi:hypothetical protein
MITQTDSRVYSSLLDPDMRFCVIQITSGSDEYYAIAMTLIGTGLFVRLNGTGIFNNFREAAASLDKLADLNGWQMNRRPK